MRKVLEIGCGQGFYSNVLARSKKRSVVGIDISFEDIQISKKRYPNVKFLQMSAEMLKFKKSTFDEVYAIEVLEHVDDLQKVLDEIARVLKVGGKLIVSVPYYKSESWLKKIRPSYFKEIHHVRVFKETELERYMKKRGFFLHTKKRKGFLQHIELYILFKRNVKSKTQLSIGSWRDNYFTKFVHITALYFDRAVLLTPLRYIPFWVVTLPIGELVNYVGNKSFPKSSYYEFIKK